MGALNIIISYFWEQHIRLGGFWKNLPLRVAAHSYSVAIYGEVAAGK
jgi:hypothetical protein